MKKEISLGLTLFVLVLLGVPGSSWIPVVKIHPSGTSFARSPQIAVSAYGVSYITWESFLFPTWEVYWVRIPPAGTSGPVQRISVYPSDGSWNDPRPRIALHAGISYVTWQGYDGNDWEIYWVKIDQSGVMGPVQMISTLPESVNEDDHCPEVATDAAGNSYVVWFGNDGNDYETYWVKIDPLGVPGNIEKISTHPDLIDEDDGGPQFCVDAAGSSYIVWGGHDGNDSEIYWVKIDPSGVPGTVQKISTHPDNVDGDDWNPQIAADSSGNSYVTWYDYGGVYWVKIDPSGIPGTVQKISTHPDNVLHGGSYPQIAVYSENCYVVWQGYDGNDTDIYWVKIDPAGIPGTVQKISTHPDNVPWGDTFPQIAADASGNSFIVWKGFDGSFSRPYFVSTVRYPFDHVAPDTPATPHEQMQPLAQYRIAKAEAVRDHVQDLLSQARSRDIDISDCEELIEKGDNFLVTARTYYAGRNYITANIYALRALQTYEEAIAFLEEVLN